MKVRKPEKKIFKLSVKVSLLFAFVTLVIMGLLVLTMLSIMSSLFSGLNKGQLDSYFAGVMRDYQNGQPIASDGRFNSLIFGRIENKNHQGQGDLKNFQNKIDHLVHSDEIKKPIIEEFLMNHLYQYINEQELKTMKVLDSKRDEFQLKIDGQTYYVTFDLKKIYGEEPKLYEILMAYTRNDFIRSIQQLTSLIISLMSALASVLIFILSFIWTRQSITKRIKVLARDTSDLIATNFKKEIIPNGNDEITNLSKSINELRKEILIKETEKQEMLQNISHDIKNPIAIIRSYAEAIEDGISGIEDIKIIKEKSIEIASRVNQLLTFIKFNYNKPEARKEIKSYKVIDLMNKLRDENKYRFKNGTIEVSGDDSEYNFYLDEFLVAIQNILDNALRYAKTLIKITIDKKILTIYNDGKEISPEFINEIFTPYKMGSDGQFGLGMGITRAILNNYSLNIEVKNDHGVKFIISPF